MPFNQDYLPDYVHVYVHARNVKYAILVLKWHISSF